jgi:hypothetical protein
VVESSPLPLSSRENFVPGGAVAHAASHKVAFYSVSDELLNCLQCLITQASVAHEGLVWFFTHRELGFSVARVVGASARFSPYPEKGYKALLPLGALGDGLSFGCGVSRVSSVQGVYRLLSTGIIPVATLNIEFVL